MAKSTPSEDIREHLRKFFAGHVCQEHVWKLGPAYRELPRLRVVEFAPGPKTGLWLYATVGAWEACEDPQLEFVLAAPEQDSRHVELLTMTASYHAKHALGAGHTLPIGQPWLSRSTCDCFLVSLPYPFGPDLEVCEFRGGHIHFRWLLPITAAERGFKIREGLEALEQRFDQCGLEYWKPERPSAI